MAEITAKVYSRTAPGTLVATLENATERRWLEELNETGEGFLTIHKDFPAEIAACEYGNIVRFALDGVDRFAFVIEPRRDALATQGEHAENTRTISGRGVLALLKKGVVLPEIFVEGSLQRQRVFDWTALLYDDSTWVATTQVQRQDAAGGTVPAYNNYPEGWPDPTAYWIWSSADNPDVSEGTSYFRKDFVATGEVIVFATGDAAPMQLWLDNELILDETTTGHENIFRKTFRADKTLGPGTHQIAASVRNGFLTVPPFTNPAALIVSVMTNVGGEPGAVIVHSDNTWSALDMPAEVPGMTLGRILRILVEEVQDRGGFPGITLDFTDTLDSNGNAWDGSPDIALEIGTNLLDVIRTVTEQFADVYMTPTLELRVYNKGTRGSDLTGTVELQVGQHFESLESEAEPTQMNAVLARDALGALTLVEDAASLAVDVRTETYLELATAPNPARAQAMVAEVFVDHAKPTVQITARVTKASGPYTAYGTGDLILAPTDDGSPADTTVLSIAVGEDDAGATIFETEGAQYGGAA